MDHLVVDFIAGVGGAVECIRYVWRSAWLAARNNITALNTIAVLAIVTILRRTRLTCATTAYIVHCAGIAIITAKSVVLIITATSDKARLRRTDFIIITV